MLQVQRLRRSILPLNFRLRVRAFVALALADMALRAFGFQRLMDQSQPSAGSERIAGAREIRRARHYAEIIEAASRHHVVRSHCLQRSLVLHRWLRQEGMHSELRIGVRKESGQLEAHAWVELGGQVVNDRLAAVRAFSALDRGPRERQASAQSVHPPRV